MAETVGKQLLAARLARGETIDQASQATHIRARYLQALEMDDWAALPSIVQGKGFLRLYAGYLDLDAQPLLAALARQQGVQIPDQVAVPTEVPAAAAASPVLPAALEPQPDEEVEVFPEEPVQGYVEETSPEPG